jgi:exonuclease III
MQILSWNVNGRVQGACERQLDRVLEVAPDVLALQEVTLGSYPAWLEGLEAADYSVVSTVDLARPPYPKDGIRRKYFNLTASRWPIFELPGLTFTDPGQGRVAFPEKYLVARVTGDGSDVDLHNAHLPPGSTRGIIKVQAFQAIRRRIDGPSSTPRILCGDCNTPQSEDEQGVETWAKPHPGLFEEWDAAERAILEHPHLRDVYREKHPSGEPEGCRNSVSP